MCQNPTQLKCEISSQKCTQVKVKQFATICTGALTKTISQCF